MSESSEFESQSRGLQGVTLDEFLNLSKGRFSAFICKEWAAPTEVQICAEDCGILDAKSLALDG